MKKTILNSFSSKLFEKGSLWVVFTALLFFASTFVVQAQDTATSASDGMAAYQNIADDFEVTVYPLGTFDAQHSKDVLMQKREQMKPTMGSADAIKYATYTYYSQVFTRVEHYSVPVEVALLLSLEDIKNLPDQYSISKTQCASIYDQTVILIQ